MAVVPPGGGSGAERDTQVQRLGTYIEGKVPGAQGQQLASQYEAYASAHPNESASEAYLAWLFSAVGKGLGKSLGDILSLSGKNAQQIAEGTVSGLDKTGKDVTNPLSWSLSATGIAGWFKRGLKMLFGGILMIVAFTHLTGADNKVTQLAMSAGGKLLPV